MHYAAEKLTVALGLLGGGVAIAALYWLATRAWS